MTTDHMLLFLGSGVSIPSNLPSVVQIGESLLSGVFYRNPKSNGAFYTDDDGTIANIVPMDRVQQVLKLLTQIDGHYLQTIAPYWSGKKYGNTGAIYRSSTSYEDLFFLTEQIKLCGVGLVGEATIGAFVDHVEHEAGDLLKGDCREARLIDLSQLASIASRFIEWLVSTSLESDKIVGLDLVADLASSKAIEGLDVVTLNHDTLVEQVLTQKGIAFADGFGSLDGEVRWHDDLTYDAEGIHVRVVKPHGSVNWYRFMVDGRERNGMLDNGDPKQCKDRNGDTITNFIPTPSFLSGTNKVTAYNRGIYTDVFYRFHKALRANKVIVMSGYGWGDIAINFRLENWLDSDREHRLVLLHETPEDLRSRSLQLDQSYKAWVNAGQLLPIQSWLCNTSVDDILAVL